MNSNIINELKSTSLLEVHSVTQSMSVDKRGNLLSDGWKVSPFFHTTGVIRWDLFLSFHYKGHEYNRDNPYAEKNRRDAIAALIRKSKECLGLKSRDLQYFGVTEMQGERCHTHTLIHNRDNSISVRLLRDTILKLIDWDVVTIPEGKLNEAIVTIQSSKKAAAYTSKLNKNDLEIQSIHFSKDFIKFANKMGKPALTRNYPLSAPFELRADQIPF